MKLLVDIGNSRVKWAWLGNAGLRDPESVRIGPAASPQVIDSVGNGRHKASEIVIASVAAEATTRAIIDSLARRHGGAVRVARTEAVAGGVRNGYLEPRQLGVDRWLALVAAYARYRKALCVVDCGTAVTVDGLARDGRHLGGFIVPGPALMRSALLRETGGIGQAAALIDRPAADDRGWGRDTESGMRRGSLRAIASLVESCVRSLGDPEGLLVVTGGDGPALIETLPFPAEHRPLLVLEGLAVSCGEIA